MKRLFALLLALVLMFTAVGCTAQPQETEPATETPTEPKEKVEDKQTQRILIIGNSHSIDAVQLLYDVFKSEEPDKDFIIGYLYYSGCAIWQHVNFYQNKEAVYRYARNSDGFWNAQEQVTLETGLVDQPWDIVFLQAAKSDRDKPNCNEADRRTLEEIVRQYVPNSDFELAWHCSWANPDDEALFSDTWPVRAPPAGYKDDLIRRYGFNKTVQYQEYMDSYSQYIAPDETYGKRICTGAAVMHAVLDLEIDQKEIYRDYTHLNDFGRLMVAYAWYAQYTGKEITSVNVTTVPKRLRWSYYQPFGDLEITEDMQKLIIECANYSLAHPWDMPGK